MNTYYLTSTQRFLFGPSIYAGEEKVRLNWLARIAGAIVVLNLLDGLATLLWILTDRAQEANPLMSVLLDFHPAAFITFKVALVNLGALLLIRYCYKSAAATAISILFFVYLAIFLFHWTMFWQLVV